MINLYISTTQTIIAIIIIFVIFTLFFIISYFNGKIVLKVGEIAIVEVFGIPRETLIGPNHFFRLPIITRVVARFDCRPQWVALDSRKIQYKITNPYKLCYEVSHELKGALQLTQVLLSKQQNLSLTALNAELDKRAGIKILEIIDCDSV